ncbi:hypothetical protein EE612_043408, partial [Oryza sativa]
LGRRHRRLSAPRRATVAADDKLAIAATADLRAKPPAATSTHHLEPCGQPPPPPPTPFDGGIEELWVKLMGHLRDAANRLRVPQPSPPPPLPLTTTKPESLPAEMDSEPEFKALPPPPLLALPQPQADGAARPWNLLQWTRRRPAASMLWAAAVPVPSSSRR